VARKPVAQLQSDHALSFRIQQVERKALSFRRGHALRREQPNLWPITVDNHEIASGRCLRQLCGGRQNVLLYRA